MPDHKPLQRSKGVHCVHQASECGDPQHHDDDPAAGLLKAVVDDSVGGKPLRKADRPGNGTKQQGGEDTGPETEKGVDVQEAHNNDDKDGNDHVIGNILLQLNIADDYFKIREKYDSLKEASEARDKELYDVKHDLITNQIKMKNLEESLQKLRLENNENQKTIVKLETELGMTAEPEEYYDDVEEVIEGTPDIVKEVEKPGNSTSSHRRTGKRRR